MPFIPLERDFIRLRCAKCSTISTTGRRYAVAMVLVATGFLLSGCSRLRHETESTNPLPVQRMSADTVVLEVTQIEIPLDEADWYAELYSQLDETKISIDMRRALAANGLRAGVTSTRLPPTIDRLLKRQEDLRQTGVNQAIPSTIVGDRSQRLQARMAHPKKFPLGGLQPSLTWFADEDGYLKGRTVTEALLQAEIISFPRPDGKVRLDVVPMIEHGQPKQRFDARPHSFILTSERDQERFDALRVSVELAAGQCLIVSRTDPGVGLGHVFFGPDESLGSGGKILLIRVAQTQLDDLFAREQIFSPIETPTE